MPPRQMVQGVLFEETDAVPPPRLQPQLQAHLLQQMVQWMQTVAVALNREGCDEQDYR